MSRFAANEQKTNFLREIIEADLASGKFDQIVTRFPPEPNGYLHIGHARNIYLNFQLPVEYGGRCHLRMDDTNPTAEKQEYVDNIQKDIQWLGFDWGTHFYLASEYFDRFYACAEHLVQNGLAYVCFLNEEEMREQRGSVSEPGTHSPYRDTSAAENLEKLRKMRDGEYADGECTLRAKIDMSAANMKLRDPPLYRIRRATHQHTGDKWCIYPMYDFAHPLSDAFEGITHSICTLEFQDNRALYDWVVDHCPVPAVPKQYEVSRANLTHTITSKRNLRMLVEAGHVDGWDDPRMPTVSGLRRRGVRPEALQAYCRFSAISKSNATVDMTVLEHMIRDDLSDISPRLMAVTDPLKVVLKNATDETPSFNGPLWPPNAPQNETRALALGDTLYIERSDFSEAPPPKWKRLAPGGEVRLRYGVVIRCDEVIKEGDKIVALHCNADWDTAGGAGRKKGVGIIHWVSANHAVPAEFRLYDRLFNADTPGETTGDIRDDLTPDSKQVLQGYVEPHIKEVSAERFQFERVGYFAPDREDSSDSGLVFNRVVTLRDTWAKAKTTSDAPAKQVADKPKNTTTDTPTGPRVASKHQARFEALQASHGISDKQAAKLVSSDGLADFFEATVSAGAKAEEAAKWLTNTVQGAVGDRSIHDLPMTATHFANWVGLVADRTLSGTIGKKVLAHMLEHGGEPTEIVKQLGLTEITDESALASMIQDILTAHPDHVARYQAGETKLTGFFIGQIMRASKGQANPQVAQRLLREALS